MTQPALGANHSNFAFLSDYDPLFLQLVQSTEQAFADRIEQAAQAALIWVNNLTQSILAKAFRGELTADGVRLTLSL
ncbi:hypothetical protein [Rheinheimera sp. EpRS3]|uniref:hypothetical protein n=1 Tax=Rheinheimera sp. EpRS3 TaxID=1712383 RepID=UPI0007497413|nr:hypothetical protein [Rheinheimera sp. EpRS3]KUM53892.1 hypothetical protein AR688_19765 [Rheinheimera sp. EpRS3]